MGLPISGMANALSQIISQPICKNSYFVTYQYLSVLTMAMEADMGMRSNGMAGSW